MRQSTVCASLTPALRCHMGCRPENPADYLIRRYRELIAIAKVTYKGLGRRGVQLAASSRHFTRPGVAPSETAAYAARNAAGSGTDRTQSSSTSEGRGYATGRGRCSQSNAGDLRGYARGSDNRDTHEATDLDRSAQPLQRANHVGSRQASCHALGDTEALAGGPTEPFLRRDWRHAAAAIGASWNCRRASWPPSAALSFL
jgi:hypothetical protein